MSSTWKAPDPSTHHVGADAPPPVPGRFGRRRHAPRHHGYRGRHDTRIILALVIAVTAMTYATSDDSGDITIQDLREASGQP